MKNCVFCNKEFKEVNKQTGRQKYCSGVCRKSQWDKENPDRVKELGKRGWIKKKLLNPVICRGCGNPIPNDLRTGGKVYCSKLCLDQINKPKINSKRIESLSEYKEFKKDLGCSKCGYNKSACALDFHHLDPTQKEFRITHCMWRSNSEYFQSEFKKCILVCKNCHAELHEEMRKL